jgi:glutamyl/glutaminyl-tRNA synthetase
LPSHNKSFLMDEQIPRFRFTPPRETAPGVANLRLALYAWAFSRAMRGDFILRPPPPTAVSFAKALTWLDVDWDEGPDLGGEYAPYHSGARETAYQEAAEQLLAAGHAYYDEAKEGRPLRFRLPAGDVSMTINDALRGEMTLTYGEEVDPALVDENGRFHPHLVAVVDDHAQAITHVVRDAPPHGAALQAALYRALGWEEPVWLHLPPLFTPSGDPLTPDVSPPGYRLADFQAEGYLPRALWNYLLLLGWTPPGDEMVDKWRVRQEFAAERIKANPVAFDRAQLRALNRRYLAGLSDEKLAEAIRPFLQEAYDALPTDEKWLLRLTAVIRDQLATLSDAVVAAAWAFTALEPDENGRLALQSAAAKPALMQLIAEIAPVVLLDAGTARGVLERVHAILGEKEGLTPEQIDRPVRAALCGAAMGPPIPAMMGLLGKEPTLQRLAAALKNYVLV